jgi:hypothetical protein
MGFLNSLYPKPNPIGQINVMQLSVDKFFPLLASSWAVPLAQLETYYDELQASKDFLAALNSAIVDVSEFAGVQFQHVNDFRVYRCLLYLFTRTVEPEVFIETGVLNGMGSVFILLAMHHNRKGTLYSIDMPPEDPKIIAQGTTRLPQGKSPGWLIPSDLRDRHNLLLGSAQVLLPQVLSQHSPPDAFLHDSDHCYSHMMFELSLAWHYLRPHGWLLCDNIEQNTAFTDFVKGVGCKESIISSFDGPERVWKHGLVQKPV